MIRSGVARFAQHLNSYLLREPALCLRAVSTLHRASALMRVLAGDEPLLRTTCRWVFSDLRRQAALAGPDRR
jgi:hypothetical protein